MILDCVLLHRGAPIVEYRSTTSACLHSSANPIATAQREAFLATKRCSAGMDKPGRDLTPKRILVTVTPAPARFCVRMKAQRCRAPRPEESRSSA